MNQRQLCRAVVAVVASASCTPLFAEQINIPNVILDRLKTTSAGKQDGGFVLKSVRILDNLFADEVRFTLPSVVPERPLVLMQNKLRNCSSGTATGRATVKKETQNSESLSRSTTFGSETSVSVSYSSPIGIGGSVSQSFQYSETAAAQQAKGQSVSWDAGLDVQLGPKEEVPVQFVVSEQTLNRVPWSANVVVKGQVELVYARPQSNVKLCVFQHAGFKGARRCWTTDKPMGVANFFAETWEGQKPNPFTLGITKQISSFTLEGDAEITFFWGPNFSSWPVKYNKTVDYVGNHDNDEFQSVKIEPRANDRIVKARIEDLLNETQRKIPFSGEYNAVNGVQGDFRTGETRKLAEKDCGLVNTTGGATTKSVSGGNSLALPPQVVAEAVAVDRNTPVMAGKVIKSGIKPVSKSN